MTNSGFEIKSGSNIYAFSSIPNANKSKYDESGKKSWLRSISISRECLKPRSRKRLLSKMTNLRKNLELRCPPKPSNSVSLKISSGSSLKNYYISLILKHMFFKILTFLKLVHKHNSVSWFNWQYCFLS